jgi:hypothetical protein
LGPKYINNQVAKSYYGLEIESSKAWIPFCIRNERALRKEPKTLICLIFPKVDRGILIGPDTPNLRTESLCNADDFAKFARQLDALRPFAPADDALYTDPDFFLNCADSGRRPKAVACWNGDDLLGVLFAYNYCFLNIPTGYAVCGDYSGRGALLARAEHRSLVAGAAVDHLMRNGIHSLRLRISPPVELRPVDGELYIASFHHIIPGDRLSLGAGYEEFLAGLGRETRRNILRSRRRALAAGLTFDSSVSSDQYAAAVRRLNRSALFPIATRRLDRDLRLIGQYHGRQFALRDAQGEIVSALCGFTHEGCFYMPTQVNDARLPEFRLSLVMRAMLIEHLIATHHKELHIMGGASLALGRYCAQLDYQCYFFDNSHRLQTLVKRLAALGASVAARLGFTVPPGMEVLAGSFLPAEYLMARTPLRPAAKLEQEALDHEHRRCDKAGNENEGAP